MFVIDLPEPDLLRVIEKWKVNQFYFCATAIRAIAAGREEWPGSYEMPSLRILGSVGEPINPEAWRWYHRNAGARKMSDRRYWWQTETGGILITPFRATLLKSCSATFPFFGVAHPFGCSIRRGNQGQRWVHSRAMSADAYDLRNHKRLEDTYFTVQGILFHGDGCRRTRMVTIIIKPGRRESTLRHRMGTAEVESALVAHESVAEAAVAGFPHEVKGEGIGAEHPERRRAFQDLRVTKQESERSSDPSPPTSSTVISPSQDLVRKTCGGFA